MASFAAGASTSALQQRPSTCAPCGVHLRSSRLLKAPQQANRCAQGAARLASVCACSRKAQRCADWRLKWIALLLGLQVAMLILGGGLTRWSVSSGPQWQGAAAAGTRAHLQAFPSHAGKRSLQVNACERPIGQMCKVWALARLHERSPGHACCFAQAFGPQR